MWYELRSLNGLTVEQIVAACKSMDRAGWQRRFEEDLVQVLVRMGHDRGSLATLQVREIPAGKALVQKDVRMTAANRQALLSARNGQTPPESKASGPLSRPQAEEDLDRLATLLETRYSYLKLRGFDYRSSLAKLRSRLGTTTTQDGLKIGIMKVLAHFGDGHTGVRGLDEALPSGFTPFLIGDTEDGLVAFRENHSSFLDPDHPYLKSLDGVSMSQWLAAASVIVPAGSPQFVRTFSVRYLRYLNYLRGELGRPMGDTVRVELESGPNGRSRVLDLPVSSRTPVYGTWPLGAHRVLSGDIGYLRLASMDEGATFLEDLKQAMRTFRGTRGLVIDVRGNGGGLRNGLRELFPYFMKSTDAPHVVNVSAYRLNRGQDPGAPEGYLSDRDLYPIASRRWPEPELAVLRKFARSFDPEWKLPAGEFSDLHYAVIRRAESEDLYYYDRPVIILMNSECFSATDIFLGAFKGWRNVTLMGTPSGGGSGRATPFLLTGSRITIALSSMASFLPDGHLYEGRGTVPDVPIKVSATDWIGKTDSVLSAAIARLSN